MKNNKAPGGTPIELVKHSPNQLKEILVDCMKINEDLLPEWEHVFIILMFKKGNRKNCNHYRGINVTKSVDRLYGRILKYARKVSK